MVIKNGNLVRSHCRYFCIKYLYTQIYVTYLIRTSEFFNRLCLKKGPDQPYYHRGAYEICFHAEEQKCFFIKTMKNYQCAKKFCINSYHFVHT